MAKSPYSSTEETTNANRACRLLLGPCTDQLRDVLRHRISPSSFATIIAKHKDNLPRLTPQQQKLILPTNGSYSGNYDDFDISLIYILLRNIGNITPHKNGWGNDPDNNDACLSANIERIRLARNSILHSAKPFLKNTEFNAIWTSVRGAVIEIDTYFSNGNLYEKEVDFLKTTTMDPIQDKHYRDRLEKQYYDDQETKECIRTLKESVGNFQKDTTSTIKHFEDTQKALEEKVNMSFVLQKQFQQESTDDLRQYRSACIPENVREQHKRIFDKWKRGIYFETSNFEVMKAFFISNQIVVVVGSPGSGKSALIRHVALQLESNYQIVPISKPENIITYGDLKRSQIFVIDDVLGMWSLEEHYLSDLRRHREQIENVLNENSKLFMSCRLSVYNEAKEKDAVFFEADKILNLNSEENNLTLEDQKGIFEAHMKKTVIPSVTDSNFLDEKGLFMFPLLCQMYSRDISIRKYGTKFFKYPYQCLLSEVDEIQKNNTIQYSSMVLCMLNNNCLSEKILNDCRMLNKVFRSCKVKGTPYIWEICDQMKHLIDTYVIEIDEKYTFIHDSIFEVVACHYGQQFPDQIIEFMTGNFIANRVVLENTDTKNELTIKLSTSHYENLAKRLYNDVKKEKLHDVFSNELLKNCALKGHFLHTLSNEAFADVNTFFLTVRKEFFQNAIPDSQKESEKQVEETKGHEESEIQDLLLGLKCIDKENIYEIYPISFIVYYGHLDLLQYLTKLVLTHQKAIDIIFGSTQQEQVKLLVLACFAGHLDMIQFLIKYLGKKSINRMPVDEANFLYNRHRCITPVIAACLRMKNEVVKYLVDNGADLNPTDTFYPALWTPAIIGDLKTIEDLLEYGADCNRCDGRGISPLYAGSRFGHLGVVEKLIEHGANINHCNIYGRSSLYIASSKGHLPVVVKLIQSGANINTSDVYGQSSLHVAAQNGHLSIVETLIRHGAQLQKNDKKNLTPLHRASIHGHASVVEKLIEHGADMNKYDDDGWSPLHRAALEGKTDVIETFIKYDADINKCDTDDQSSLSLASWKGHLPVVEKLIQNGADINKCNGRGRSPLHSASDKGYLSVVETLIQHGADINRYDRKKFTPLLFATRKGNLLVVEKILEHGADVDKCNVNGQTALHLASRKGYNSIVEKLTDYGAGINKCDTNGQSSMHLASRYGHLSVVETLIQKGAKYMQGDKNSVTPLHRASQGGHLPVVKKLIDSGADVNKCDIYDVSPLHLASKEGHLSVVETLIKCGADIFGRDIDGRTSLNLASKYLHTSVVEKLMQEITDRDK